MKRDVITVMAKGPHWVASCTRLVMDDDDIGNVTLR